MTFIGGISDFVNQQPDQYFRLYSCLIPVKGYLRSILVDLHNEEIIFLQDSCFKLIEISQNQSISNISFDNKTFVKDFEFLIEKNYGLLLDADELILFPQFDLKWETSSEISNIIFDINEESYNWLKNNIHLLYNLNCFHFHFTASKYIDYQIILNFLNLISTSLIRSVEFTFMNDFYSESCYKEILHKEPRVKLILILNSQFAQILSNPDTEGKIIRSKDNELYMSPKNIDSLVLNIPFFTESQNHHSYFNRKLFISSTGEIKNAPECEDVFGNIFEINSETEFRRCINNPKFQKFWLISKDKIDVCKSCEFRYLCTDNRLPHKRKDGTWFHKTECNFNPYIARWKGEKGYLTLPECGITSDENGFRLKS